MIEKARQGILPFWVTKRISQRGITEQEQNKINSGYKHYQ